MGNCLGLGGQHVQRQQGGDLLAETVLRLELGAIGPGLELRRPGGVAGGVGREPLLGDDFAQFPGVGIRGVGLGQTLTPCRLSRRERGVALSAATFAVLRRAERYDRPLAEDIRPHDLFRLLEAVDLQRPFGPLRLAVERGRGELDLDRLAGRKPIAGGERGPQGRVAGLHRPLRGAGFAVGVGHVGKDLVLEDRLVFLRHGKVRLGDELDLERAVGLGLGRAVGDLLRARTAANARQKHQYHQSG